MLLSQRLRSWQILGPLLTAVHFTSLSHSLLTHILRIFVQPALSLFAIPEGVCMFVGYTARPSEKFAVSKRRLGLIRLSLRANWFGDQTLCVCLYMELFGARCHYDITTPVRTQTEDLQTATELH